MEFQIISSLSRDFRGTYTIILYGAQADGQSVCCAIEGFRPYFFVELPSAWTREDVCTYKEFLLRGLPKEHEHAHVKFEIQRHETLWDFTNNEKMRILHVSAKTKRQWESLWRRCLDKDTMRPIPYTSRIGDHVLTVFEANLDPMLRFFHERELPPAGWVRLEDGMWDDDSETSISTAAITIKTERDSVNPASAAVQMTTAPLRTMPFDIECTSSHGDFPLATKTWRKPARELVEAGFGAGPKDGALVCAAIEAAIKGDAWPLEPAGLASRSTVLARLDLLSPDVWAELCVPTTKKKVTAFWATHIPELDAATRTAWTAALPAFTSPSHVESAVRAALSDVSWPLSRVFLQNPAVAFSPDLDELYGRWAGWKTTQEQEQTIDALDALLTDTLPPIAGDPIIQIGSVVYTNGRVIRKDICVLGECTKLPDQGGVVRTHVFETEAALIRGWCAIVAEVDPDILVGYNIFIFDDKYLFDRATVCGCSDALAIFGRETDARRGVQLEKKSLSSSAMGDNFFYQLPAVGRLQIDLLAYVKRNNVLDSYSLDNVTATFMSGGVSAVTPGEDGQYIIKTKSTKGTTPGRFVVLMDEENDVIGGEKLEVVAVEPKALYVRPSSGFATALRDHGAPPARWSQSKDDVSPKEIFRLHASGPNGRARVAKYCLQDCDLVMELFQKLEVLNNAVAMANVCWVPVEFIFTRGQGIKAESLTFYECRKRGQLIPVLPSPPPQLSDSELVAAAATKEDEDEDETVIRSDEDDKEGYEGAIVLNPRTGVYFDDDPVAALDFSSLYPSTIMSENISYDSLVWVKDWALDGTFLRTKEGSDKYDNLPGWDYLNIEFDILRAAPTDTRKHPKLLPWGRRVCRFAQNRDPAVKSTLPTILGKLLKQRKAVRKLAEKEPDEFRRALLDATQLAYKLTANSMYGQLGSNTSKIRRKCLAASTTAHGREQLLFSKASIEACYGPKTGDPRCSALCVYGDTDSIFISFRPMDPATGMRLRGRAAQEAAKALAEEAGHLISGALKPPHDFEFDKMFRCFCLLSKKRYVGDMTEGGLEDDDYHRKSMGIVMKRRDNAPIVKYVYGGVIERILNLHDIKSAFEFAQASARELVAGRFSLKKLTITKSLKAEYKMPPPHKQLADRMGKRDPGNKPASNERLGFAYITRPKGAPEPVTQGDRIETPAYITEHGLKPDYVFYITNQISKPVAQVFALVLESLPGFRPSMLTNSKKRDPVARREDVALELLFGEIVRDAKRDASGQRDLRTWFGPRA